MGIYRTGKVKLNSVSGSIRYYPRPELDVLHRSLTVLFQVRDLVDLQTITWNIASFTWMRRGYLD